MEALRDKLRELEERSRGDTIAGGLRQMAEKVRGSIIRECVGNFLS